jgi:hypothetical protein
MVDERQNCADNDNGRDQRHGRLLQIAPVEVAPGLRAIAARKAL